MDEGFTEALEEKIIESGEYERWRDLLRSRLMESGWKDQVKMICRETVKQNPSENISADSLYESVIPQARTLVPDAVKMELLTKIKAFLQQEASTIN